MDNCIDNVFEWYTGEKVAGVTFSQRKWINKVKKYAEDYPDDVVIEAENDDGSIFAKIPVSWFKMSPPKKGREFTEEEKAAIAERFALAREKRKQNND